MIGVLARYARWLHTRWPAATLEKLPAVDRDGRTAIPGVFVAGDLTGVPLLKFALDGGARAARAIAADPALRSDSDPALLDLVIVGAGVAGMAAALEARECQLSFEIVEAAEPFATLESFPRGKPIFLYPSALTPAGPLQARAVVKEPLVEELRAQAARAGIRVRTARAERVAVEGGRRVVELADGTRLAARRIVIAIGRSGNVRRLRAPGEDLPHVFHRLHDPSEFAGRNAVVVGGGDTAIETAIALALAGAAVTLCHRGADLARARPENVDKLRRLERDPLADVTLEHPSDEQVSAAAGGFLGADTPRGRIVVRLDTAVKEIRPAAVVVEAAHAPAPIAADAVFVMIGREAPLEFFRRSGIPVSGDAGPRHWITLILFVAFCAWLYDWKSGGFFTALWTRNGWFPTRLPEMLAGLSGEIGAAARDRRTLLGTIAISGASPAFLYTLAYSVVIAVFGVRRIRRRRTPYVTAQTLTLMALQILPLFLIPEIVLPLLDANGLLPRAFADALFPAVGYGHGREFWRAYGFILAFPLNVYNVFTHQPLPWWIAISIVQTLVLIPLGVHFFGKGFYCGWICSCGALAETLGDTHRHKMPHGPGWNRLNLAGQAVLAIALALLAVRIAGWVLPAGNAAERLFESVLEQRYKWWIDVGLAGVVGYGVYFWYSGRVWCRFFCPLAAWMNVCARFSQFRIFADKKKCISCGQCTRQCHQGIDVMSFANKGVPMADPQCVRCSACVEVCPTGVLSFGRAGAGGLVTLDSLLASPVQIRERAVPPGGGA